MLEDAFAAVVGAVILGALMSGLFWLTMGLSPWPMVVVGAVGGFGFGLAMLAVTSPRRER